MTKDSNNNSGIDFGAGIRFEEILSNPILDIAARFWEADRYDAFQTCYRSMRRIDDLVDDLKESGRTMTPGEIDNYSKMIDDWLVSAEQGAETDDYMIQFNAIRKKFVLPIWPWKRLCKAMIYDLKHDGFKSFMTFLRYTEGAAIAPASIFMHLSGIRKDGDYFSPPEYDIREAARPLALFSYVVHILRDFQIDVERDLNYFPDKILEDHFLTFRDLKYVVSGEAVDDRFRSLMATYRRIGEYYRAKAVTRISEIKPKLGERYQLGFEIIFALYDQIFERVKPETSLFSTSEMNPTPEEVQARLELTISQFNQ